MKWYDEWKENYDVEKARKYTESTAEGFWEAFYLATTFHGRYKMSKIILSAREGEIDIDPKVLGLYQYLLLNVPYQAYAVLN